MNLIVDIMENKSNETFEFLKKIILGEPVYYKADDYEKKELVEKLTKILYFFFKPERLTYDKPIHPNDKYTIKEDGW